MACFLAFTAIILLYYSQEIADILRLYNELKED